MLIFKLIIAREYINESQMSIIYIYIYVYLLKYLCRFEFINIIY